MSAPVCRTCGGTKIKRSAEGELRLIGEPCLDCRPAEAQPLPAPAAAQVPRYSWHAARQIGNATKHFVDASDYDQCHADREVLRAEVARLTAELAFCERTKALGFDDRDAALASEVAEVAALRKDLESAKHENLELNRQIAAAMADSIGFKRQSDALRAKLDESRAETERLRPYVQHKDGCDYLTTKSAHYLPLVPCTCGLMDALTVATQAAAPRDERGGV